MADSSMLKVARDLSEKHVVATPANFQEVEVVVDLGAKVLTTYVHELYANLEVAVSMKGGNLPFKEDQLFEYVTMVIQQRVDYVNGLKVEFRPTDSLAIPSYISLLLSSIGLVQSTDLGLILKPTVAKRVIVKREDMEKISRALMAAGPYGLEYSKGYERSKDGSWEFMSMTLMDEFVMGLDRKTHPVFALLSSTLALRGIEAVLSPRVSYGSEEHFTAIVRHLATLKG